jgi:hypothetical protein
MDRLKVFYNNIENKLITPTTSILVARRFGHPFLLWSTSLRNHIVESFNSNPCFLTDIELKRLHRRFGHPSVNRLAKVLERAGHEIDKEALEHLTKFCHFCQKHRRSPRRFRFTLRDDVDFNFYIIVDVMYISGKPLLYIVDEGT